MSRRGALILNPNATATSDELLEVIAAALRSEVDLDVLRTTRRDHATELAAAAVADGCDVVFSLGGDGTANEVLQALAGTTTTMGVIPAGGANVMARTLGFPNDPVVATSLALDALRHGRRRTINLGRADHRYFAFDAGFGFDAGVVQRVEANPDMKRRFRQAAFVWLALRAWVTDDQMRDPHITLTFDDGSTEGPVGIVMVGNADPYTFLGRTPIRMTPDADLDGDLDVTAIRRVGTPQLVSILARLFANGRHVRHPAVLARHDVAGFTVESPRPTPLMVDGEYVGDRTDCRFRSVPSSLVVLANDGPIG